MDAAKDKIKELLQLDDEYFGILESYPDFFYFGEHDIMYCLCLDGVDLIKVFDPDSKKIQENYDRYKSAESRIRIEHGDKLIVYAEDGIKIEKVVQFDANFPTEDWIRGATRSEFDSWFRSGKGRKAKLIRGRHKKDLARFIEQD